MHVGLVRVGLSDYDRNVRSLIQRIKHVEQGLGESESETDIRTSC